MGYTVKSYYWGTIILTLLTFVYSGCDTTEPEEQNKIVAGVDLDELFAPPQPAEVQSVLDEWDQRDISVQNLVEVSADTLDFGAGKKGIARVVSHDVGGVTHFGAIVVPVGATAGSLPVLIYNHGGDGGENLDVTLTFLSLGISEIIDQFVYVVPSFRDEPLIVNGVRYQSEGPASPWDLDVDDALALLNVALETTPEANTDRIGAFGFSRGGGVSLLMAIRDPRIDLVSEFFGPTNFYVQDVEDTIVEALNGELRNLPGLNYLDEMYIQPLKNGAISMAEARIQMVRRSPVLFADRLPDVQIQHGEQDDIVAVDHAQSLAETLQNMGRNATELELHIYPNAGHSPLEMIGSFERFVDFVERLMSASS